AALAAALAATVAFAAAFALGARRARVGGRLGRRRARVLLAQQRLTRQLHPILVVDRDHLHPHPVADLDHVLDPADVALGQLRDVAQAVAAGQDFDERPELLDRRNLDLVHLADLVLLCDRLDTHPGLLDPGI